MALLTADTPRRRAGIAKALHAPGHVIARLWAAVAFSWRGIGVGRRSRISPLASLRPGGGRIEIGAYCDVMRGSLLWAYGGSIRVGDSTTINPYCVLYGHGGLTIGRGVRIASHVVIVPANHGIEADRFIFKQPETRRGIVIEDDVWVGSGARILDGVTLAHGSVIGAGAVVARSTEPFGIYAGVPARKIGDRRTRSKHAGAQSGPVAAAAAVSERS